MFTGCVPVRMGLELVRSGISMINHQLSETCSFCFLVLKIAYLVSDEESAGKVPRTVGMSDMYVSTAHTAGTSI